MRGYDSAAQLLAARRQSSPLSSGTVLKKTIGHYWVRVDGRTLVCTLSSRLRKVLVYPVADASSLHPRVQEVGEIKVADPVAIGDVVGLLDSGNGAGVIVEVTERINALVRRAAGSRPLEQIIAANVDQVVCVVAAAKPAPSWELLDRYLAAAEAAGLPGVICVTKVDLLDPAKLQSELDTYRRIGYRVLTTSAASGFGIDELRAALDGRVSVLAGKSGVGKTSLLNVVQPGLGLRVREVSGKTGKGKHTTTHLELFALNGGGGVVDTPGMREFALWNVADRELAALYPEMRPFVGACRFGAGCSHVHEPGCAVKEAVAEDAISQRRHASYVRLLGETERAGR